MNDDINTVCGPAHGLFVENIPLDEFELGITAEGQQALAAVHQIIEHADVMAGSQQPGKKDRTDISGAAGDEHVHG
jgi:hypothetical protein